MMDRATRRGKTRGLLCLSLLVGFRLVLAQDMAVPSSLQYQLFLKIMSYDRQLMSRMEADLVIAIIYQSGFRASRRAMEDFLEAIKTTRQKEFEKVSIRALLVDLDKESDLEKSLGNNKIHVIYITPLRAYEIKSITSFSRSKKVITFTGVPDYAEKGISVGIGLRGESPQIIINLVASREEGADFSSNLLNLAKVIQNEQE